jgi:hypothetical protein
MLHGNLDLISCILKYLNNNEIFELHDINQIWNKAVITEFVYETKQILPKKGFVFLTKFQSLTIKIEEKGFIPNHKKCLNENGFSNIVKNVCNNIQWVNTNKLLLYLVYHTYKSEKSKKLVYFGDFQKGICYRFWFFIQTTNEWWYIENCVKLT